MSSVPDLQERFPLSQKKDSSLQIYLRRSAGCRVGTPEQAISTAQAWDPELRKLTLKAIEPRVWAFHNTGSEKSPLGKKGPLGFYLPSGAAEYNGVTASDPILEGYFNEVCHLEPIAMSFQVHFSGDFLCGVFCEWSFAVKGKHLLDVMPHLEECAFLPSCCAKAPTTPKLQEARHS